MMSLTLSRQAPKAHVVQMWMGGGWVGPCIFFLNSRNSNYQDVLIVIMAYCVRSLDKMLRTLYISEFRNFEADWLGGKSEE